MPAGTPTGNDDLAPASDAHPLECRASPTGPPSPDGTFSWRAMLMRMPDATKVSTSDDPPKEMKGSGIPVTGSTPTTAPMLIMVSLATQATSPMASRPPKRSEERVATRIPNHTKVPSSRRTATAPTNPSSSPITEKMKSVWALGR
jgi:hypothetical protein